VPSEHEVSPASFTATIEAGRCKQLLTAVGAVVEECRLHLDADGLSIKAVDPANVAMLDLHLSAAAFETYSASGGVIGVSITRPREAVKMAGTSDEIDFELNPDTRKLHTFIDELEHTRADRSGIDSSRTGATGLRVRC
jgi:proliferating cell nuclear antigen